MPLQGRGQHNHPMSSPLTLISLTHDNMPHNHDNKLHLSMMINYINIFFRWKWHSNGIINTYNAWFYVRILDYAVTHPSILSLTFREYSNIDFSTFLTFTLLFRLIMILLVCLEFTLHVHLDTITCHKCTFVNKKFTIFTNTFKPIK